MLIALLIYFTLLLLVSRLTGKGGNDAFFRGERKSPWPLVAFGMIGASISGLTFIGVPGWVMTTNMTYLQMCLGFIVGYIIVAFVLLPLYYKYNLTSIYTYLSHRFGRTSYKTGSSFFIISKLLGAAAKFYVVVQILQTCIADQYGIPYTVTAIITLLFIWIYTKRSGIRTLVWTDALKTVCMIVSIALAIIFIAKALSLDFSGLCKTIKDSEYSKIFFFEDVNDKEYFWKQFLAGIFTVIAMTGLDQDMMQRTLSSKNARDSKQNLITSGLLQVPVIFLFLCLGALMYIFAGANGISETGDTLFPAVATGGYLPAIVGVLFVLGLVSCAFSAGGSALTALTTSFTVDILGVEGKSEEKVTATRKKVHLAMAVLMGVVIFIFYILNTQSAIDMVYKLASYTYGPILGLFAFGIFTKWHVRDRWVPLIAILAPCVCLVLQMNSERWFGGYRFSYEILIINALLTFLGLCLIRRK